MNKPKKDAGHSSCCKVEAMVSLDERGQILLPKDLRERAGLKPGDKLAVVAAEDKGEICCLYLIRSDRLAGLVKELLGPVMKDLV